MKTIALSAGHSDKDPGAVYNGLVERDIVEKIVAYASPMLRSHGVGVLNPPSSLDLNGTIKWINDRSSQIDACIEVHVNSSAKPDTGFGLEVWHYRDSEESKKFASFVLDATGIESGMSVKRGVKDEKYANIWGRLGFVHNTKPNACLIECGFINTEMDRKVLSTDTGLYNLAKGIVRGIVSYLGITWVAPVGSISNEGGYSDDNKAEIERLKKLLEEQKKSYDTQISDFKVSLADKEKECLRLSDLLLQISRLSTL